MANMFEDINIHSKQIQADFKKAHSEASLNGIEFVVEVLTEAHWPEHQRTPHILPIELKNCQDKFDQFYNNKF